MHYTGVLNRYTRYDTKLIVDNPWINWEKFKNSTILITGATGFIGTQLVLSLAKASLDKKLNLKLILLVRNKKKAEDLFLSESYYTKIKFIQQDINKPIKHNEQVDYIIHTASNTSSKSFVETPVETISTNLNGTKNILEFAKHNNIKSIVYLSSMEIYGTVNSDTPLKESDYGYSDLLNERNSYPQAKRLAETLCYSYFKEYETPVKIARLSQIIGANIPYDDNRVFAQFARNVVENHDIILYSSGGTVRNYCYITDCITAILTILLKGNNGEAYNITNSEALCSIKEMAEKICKYGTNSQIQYEITNDNKYLPELKMLLDTSKLKKLDWRAEISTKEMFEKLVNGYKSQINTDIINNSKSKLIEFIKKYINVMTVYNHKYFILFGIKFKINMDKLYKYFFAKLPINKKKIVFSSHSGICVGCNPKSICMEMLKSNKNYKIIWLIAKNTDKKNLIKHKNIKYVKYNSFKSLFELATAKIWVNNQLFLYHYNSMGMFKRSGQKYIQTWHGALGIKKVLFHDKFNIIENNLKDIDYLISNSKFENEVYKDNFLDSENKILEYGHARNDIFFSDSTSIKDKIHKEFNISHDKKILLYAPTFRDNFNVNITTLNLDIIKQNLEKNTGSNWQVLIRLHHNDNLFQNLLDGNYINASNYPDAQELLACTDMLITDYSSIMFDFMLTKRPCFIYAQDIEEYEKMNGFYYPLETTPFPIAKNENELIEKINNFDNVKYQKDIETFLLEKGSVDDGKASERIVNLISELIEE